MQDPFLVIYCQMLDIHRSDLCFFSSKKITNMSGGTSNLFVRNAAQWLSSPPFGRVLNIIENLEGLPAIDTISYPRDSPEAVVKKTGHVNMSPSSPLPLFHGHWHWHWHWHWGSA